MKNNKEVIYMPHSGHFICSQWCNFFLNTYVNGYIISTVGEYVPDSDVRRILRKSRNMETDLIGDEEREDFGFEDIGYNRKYETMVFLAGKPCAESGCNCGLPKINGDEQDFAGYNTAGDANQGHKEMVEKWIKKQGDA